MVRARNRAYGGIGLGVMSMIATLFMLTQENWQDMWVALCFTSAFSVGFLIYAKSNWSEKNRLAKEKDKRKGKKK